MTQRINSTQATYIILSQEVSFYNQRISKLLSERLENNVRYLLED